jgi:cold shock CspA family protein
MDARARVAARPGTNGDPTMSPDTPETAPAPVSEAAAPPAAAAPEGAPLTEPATTTEAPTAAAPATPPKPEIEYPEDAKKGRIRSFNAGNKQGELQPEDGSTTVKFHIKQVANPQPEPRDGDRVAYRAPEATKTA